MSTTDKKNNMRGYEDKKMARSRNIKPGFFTNDNLAEVEPLGRLLFAGLWTIADRAGRLGDRPKKIKATVLPYDEVDVDGLLSELARRGFIVRYSVEGNDYIQVVNWDKHQNPHKNEAGSTIPAPCLHSASTVQTQDEPGTRPADSFNLIPDSLNLIPDQQEGASLPIVGAAAENLPATLATGAVIPADQTNSLDGYKGIANDQAQVFISIPLNDRTLYDVLYDQVRHWQQLYPAIDVPQQLRNVLGWCEANPTKRKTRRGIPAFITRWLANHQDRGGKHQSHPTTALSARERESLRRREIDAVLFEDEQSYSAFHEYPLGRIIDQDA